MFRIMGKGDTNQNSEKGRAPRPVVLGDAVRDGRRLWAFCEECRHQAYLDPAALAQILGYDATIYRLRTRLRCSNCRGRAVDVRVDYGGPGVVARHRPKT